MNSRLTILNPCPKRWDDLDGDDRQRYCADCGRSVHAFDQYSPAEREKIWSESNGRICATMDSKPTEPPRSRRVLLAGALLSAISPLMAQTGRVRIRVTDVTGAVIPRASVTLLRAPHDKFGQTLQTNDAGEVVWTDLPMGNSIFRIDQAGFKALTVMATVSGSREVMVDAVLQFAVMGEVVAVPLQPSPLPRSLPQTKRRRRWLIF